MGGSIDEMYNPNKSKDEVKAISIASIKEIYEQQLSELAKINEAHINNIRSHYEQHRQDFKENVEKRFADKREIIAQQEEHIKTLKKENRTSRIFTVICVVVLVGLLIAEVMNPNLGWFSF
jgi:membrane-bound lytic murein transglycosylase MltF